MFSHNIGPELIDVNIEFYLVHSIAGAMANNGSRNPISAADLPDLRTSDGMDPNVNHIAMKKWQGDFKTRHTYILRQSSHGNAYSLHL